MDPAIEVRGLTKRYKNGVVANEDVTLSVPAGTIFGLLGPNGAGKTTLVRQLTGELLPTAGEVSVLGIDVIRDPYRAKSVMGIVPQEAGPFFALKTEEHLHIFGQLHGLNTKEARRRADQLFKDLDLEVHRHKLTSQLSGGLVRKMLVGMAVIAQPEVLVLDEPTTGLDPNCRHEVWALIRRFQQAGSTILLTTHYMEEAEALCSQVAILGQGRILATGSVDEIRGLSSRRFKATYQSDGTTAAIYGETHEEVAVAIEQLHVAEYAVSKTSLEDLYIELTGKS